MRKSSPIYNTSDRHEQHECHTSVTQATRVRHERDTSHTPASENFDFDNDMSGNIFSHSYIYYMANERLQGETQFCSRKLPSRNALFPWQNAFKKRATHYKITAI